MLILDFEKKLADKKSHLLRLQLEENPDNVAIDKLSKQVDKLEIETYHNLTPWQVTQIARHPDRPGTIQFINREVEDFIELSGDRFFGDDQAIIGGLGKLGHFKFMIIGHAKGSNVQDNVKHNFGMPHPEGYRKAIRLMKLADQFKIPIITLVDTPGAYPGIKAEERQQSRAIAESLQIMGTLKVPIITVILGEGGSGGALALAVSNKILMLKYSIFGVISAEGCATILWNDATKNIEAAELLKYTANDLQKLNVIDDIINEPLTGAHNNPDNTLQLVRKAILQHYMKLKKLKPEDILQARLEKFRNLGVYKEAVS